MRGSCTKVFQATAKIFGAENSEPVSKQKFLGRLKDANIYFC